MAFTLTPPPTPARPGEHCWPPTLRERERERKIQRERQRDGEWGEIAKRKMESEGKRDKEWKDHIKKWKVRVRDGPVEGVRERGSEMKERERERQRYIERNSMGEIERGNDK